jgi:NAD(P)-dependent dehydrogenase (short-subunit alcohol dehydrogenase family)
MALALADKGIRVNAVAPGTIATELAAKAVLTSEEAKAAHHEPHADEAAGRAVRSGGRWLPGWRATPPATSPAKSWWWTAGGMTLELHRAGVSR